MMLYTDSAIMVYPPNSLLSENWLVTSLKNKMSFKVSAPVLGVFLYCNIPRAKEDVYSYFYEKYRIDRDLIDFCLTKLIDKKLLLEDNLDSERIKGLAYDPNIYSRWYEVNWMGALHYHLSSYDYQFIEDYEAKARMMDFSEMEKDDNRYKVYDTAPELFVPKVIDINNDLKSQYKGGCINKDLLATILSLGYSQTGSLHVYWDGEPLLLRTSPSGGSRHPTETYVVAINVDGLDPGWYHFSVQDRSLREVKKGWTDTKSLKDLLPTTYTRAKFQVDLIFVYTSIFERNMYRYRDPRTFRTIHMDVGHLVATTEVILEETGLEFLVQYSANDKGIENFLNIDPLVEGYIASMSVGR